MGLPFEPWHMWGGVQNVSLPAVANAPFPSIQLANVNYLRPETWTFFLAAQLMQIGSVPANDIDFYVNFHIITGLGRTAFDTSFADARAAVAIQSVPFARMRMKLLAGQTVIDIQAKRWTTQTLAPALDDSAPTNRLPLDSFPAQDIRCLASIFQDTPTPITAQFALTALFAPRTHNRPEWFRSPPQFRGNEAG